METLLAGIASSLSPLTTRDQRLKVDKYLTDLTRSKDSIGWLMGLLNADFQSSPLFTAIPEVAADSVRLLVVTLVSLWIQENWNKLSSGEQLELREGIVFLLRSSPLSSPQGSRALAIKLSVLIGDVAELQYPQHWPSFVGDMLVTWSDPSASLQQRTAVISAIEGVATDCIDSDFSSKLPPHRIQDILEAFKVEMNPVLQTAYTSFISCISTNQYELARAVLNMLVPIFSFLKIDDIFAHSGIYFTHIIVHSLSIKELQSEAADCLHSIARFNYQDNIDTLVLVMKSLATATIAQHSGDLEETLAFQRVFAESVFSIFSENFSVVTEPSFLANDGAQDFIARYVTLMAGLVGQPSRRLACDVGRDWIKVFKDDTVFKLPWMEAVSYRVLCEYFHKIKKPLVDKLDDVADAEFDNKDDLIDFLNTFKALVRQLTSQIATTYPRTALQFLTQSLPVIINTAGMMGSAQVDASVGVEWDAYLVVFDAVISKFPVESSAYESDIKSLVNSLLVWRAANSVTQIYQLKLIQSCSPILHTHADALFYTFQVLFDSIRSNAATKQKVAVLISYLCEKNIDTLVSSAALPLLMDQLSSILDLKDPQCRTPTVAAIVTIATHMPVTMDQQRYLYLALKDIISNLTSRDIANIIASPSSILQSSIEGLALLRTYVGDIFAVAKGIQPPVLPDDVWTKSSLYSLADSFSFITVWEAILPTVIGALVAINGLWEPSFRARMETTGMAAFYEASWHDMGMVRNPNSDKVGKPALIASPDDSMHKAKAYIAEIRSFLFQILGQASQHKALYLHPQHAALVTSLAHSITYMENHHYLLVLKLFVESYAINAPPVVFSDASAFLGAFLAHSAVRLSHIWNLNLPDKGDSDPLLPPWIHGLYRYTLISGVHGYSKDDADLIRERVATDMSRSLCDVMSALVCIRGVLAVRAVTSVMNKKHKEKGGSANSTNPTSGWTVVGSVESVENPLGNLSKLKIAENEDERIRLIRKRAIDSLVLGQYDVVTKNLLCCVQTTLSVPDSQSVEKSLRLAHIFADRCSNDVRFVDAVGGRLFNTAMDILLRQEEYLQGIEWSVSDFMVKVYCLLVLPDSRRQSNNTLDYQKSQRKQPSPPSGMMHQPTKLWGAFSQLPANGAPRSVQPRLVLLGVPGVVSSDVDGLEKRLSEEVRERQRKEYFRDFLIKLIRALGIKNTLDRDLTGAVESVFSASAVSVQPVRVKDLKKSRSQKPPAEEVEANLSDIFSDV